jgi:hypothetical protein
LQSYLKKSSDLVVVLNWNLSFLVELLKLSVLLKLQTPKQLKYTLVKFQVSDAPDNKSLQWPQHKMKCPTPNLAYFSFFTVSKNPICQISSQEIDWLTIVGLLQQCLFLEQLV